MEKTTYEQLSSAQKEVYDKIEDIVQDHRYADNIREVIDDLFNYVDKQIKICLCSAIL